MNPVAEPIQIKPQLNKMGLKPQQETIIKLVDPLSCFREWVTKDNLKQKKLFLFEVEIIPKSS